MRPVSLGLRFLVAVVLEPPAPVAPVVPVVPEPEPGAFVVAAPVVAVVPAAVVVEGAVAVGVFALPAPAAVYAVQTVLATAPEAEAEGQSDKALSTWAE